MAAKRGPYMQYLSDSCHSADVKYKVPKRTLARSKSKQKQLDGEIDCSYINSASQLELKHSLENESSHSEPARPTRQATGNHSEEAPRHSSSDSDNVPKHIPSGCEDNFISRISQDKSGKLDSVMIELVAFQEQHENHTSRYDIQIYNIHGSSI